MLTSYNVITLYSQTVGHQGLRLQGNDLIRKEKEDTGVRKKLSAVLDSLAALPGEDTIDPQQQSAGDSNLALIGQGNEC